MDKRPKTDPLHSAASGNFQANYRECLHANPCLSLWAIILVQAVLLPRKTRRKRKKNPSLEL
jgi:hypothetical protein